MVTKKKKSASKKTPKVQSFKTCKELTPFMSFKVTKQTAYWSFLFFLIFVLVIWVLSIQLDILKMLNSIIPF